MGWDERIWQASVEEWKQGYVEESDRYVCLLCGHAVEKGIVYPADGVLYEASRFVRIHVGREHGSVFDYVIGLDKKLTGLTEHQNRLLRLFHEGKSDDEVRAAMGIGSASTIRNHRFALKEKERQAKLFLVLMELLKDKDRHAPAFVGVHPTAGMIDERYNVTEAERKKVLDQYFPEGWEGPLRTFPPREKTKLIVLRQLAVRFHRGRIYSEKEVNEVLKEAYGDYVTLRRYLIAYGFLEREPDGSRYWVKK